MTRMEAERRAMELSDKEPKTTGLTFAAKPVLPEPGKWYVAGFHGGKEVSYVRE